MDGPRASLVSVLTANPELFRKGSVEVGNSGAKRGKPGASGPCRWSGD